MAEKKSLGVSEFVWEYLPTDRPMRWSCASYILIHSAYIHFCVSYVSTLTEQCHAVWCVSVPDIEGAFLIGSEGSWSGAHTVVHHLLSQVMNLGLKTPVLWEHRHKQTLSCQHTTATNLYTHIYSCTLISDRVHCKRESHTQSTLVVQREKTDR